MFTKFWSLIFDANSLLFKPGLMRVKNVIIHSNFLDN